MDRIKKLKGVKMFNIRINKYRIKFEIDGKKKTGMLCGCGNMKDIRAHARKVGAKIISIEKIKN